MTRVLSRIDLALMVCVIAIGVACATLGFGQNIDLGLRQARNGLHPRSASGDIAVVEIDSKSLAAIDRWPWPRSNHAKLVDRLYFAGARIIAFDVDFSTASNEREDRLFSDALARAKGAVVLPTFRQQRSSSSSEIYENLPITILRDHAFLGAVNIFNDDDGLVRRYETGVVTDSEMRPSVAALLAEVPSLKSDSYTIDFSIDPNTIPRFSYIDVLNGTVPVNKLAHKRILIGATAIEMGDRYAVPGHGVLPGVIIQALAAETLYQGSVDNNLGGWPLLILSSAIMLFVAARQSNLLRGLIMTGGVGLILLLPFALEILKLGTLDCAPALMVLSLGTLVLGVRHIQSKFYHYRTTDADTGMPNSVALARDVGKAQSMILATARIHQFSEICSFISSEQKSELLHRIADRLKLAAETSTVYRVEENALAWVVANGNYNSWADRFEGLSALFRASIVIGGRAIDIVPTFGLSEGNAANPQSMIGLALLAADRAAQQGIRWDIHNVQHGIDLDWKLSLLGGLDDALLNGDFWVAYQPKVSLGTGEIIGAEALIRWSHRTRGQIAPDHFIPTIEAAGRIHDLTFFVIKSALSQVQHWNELGLLQSVAVNISASLLRDKKFITDVIKLLRISKIEASRLVFEITESAALADPEAAISAMHQLRDLGLGISIDDYGTGQSTLSYLKRLPASEVKIDKCFITNLLNDKSDQILVRSTISLAHELGFKVVAEGIEDIGCFQLLGSFGCDIGQGWHIGKPMPIDDFNILIAGQQLKAA